MTNLVPLKSSVNKSNPLWSWWPSYFQTGHIWKLKFVQRTLYQNGSTQLQNKGTRNIVYQLLSNHPLFRNKILPTSRVTRLCEFSHIERLFSLGSYFQLQKVPNVLAIFSTEKAGYAFFQKTAWLYFRQFKKSSGHPTHALVCMSIQPYVCIFCR
jgi:hypothetical protein